MYGVFHLHLVILYGNFMLGKYTSPIENLGVGDPWINVML